MPTYAIILLTVGEKERIVFVHGSLVYYLFRIKLEILSRTQLFLGSQPPTSSARLVFGASELTAAEETVSVPQVESVLKV